MIVEKRSRIMEAWRLGVGLDMPADVAAWVFALPNGLYAVVSPRAPHHVVIAAFGWWVIRTEVGCLYAVTPWDFDKKYSTDRAGPLSVV